MADAIRDLVPDKIETWCTVLVTSGFDLDMSRSHYCATETYGHDLRVNGRRLSRRRSWHSNRGRCRMSGERVRAQHQHTRGRQCHCGLQKGMYYQNQLPKRTNTGSQTERLRTRELSYVPTLHSFSLTIRRQ